MKKMVRCFMSGLLVTTMLCLSIPVEVKAGLVTGNGGSLDATAVGDPLDVPGDVTGGDCPKTIGLNHIN